jgi:hypothetical protein
VGANPAGNYTIGTWLGSGGATILTNTIPLTTSLDNGTQGVLIDFKGLVTVTTNQSFTTTHDDGLTLVIGGMNVITASGPTSPTVTTVMYTGPSGTLPFELIYGECCGAPAVLNISLPLLASIPEPESIALLACGLLGAGIIGIRRRRL